MAEHPPVLHTALEGDHNPHEVSTAVAEPADPIAAALRSKLTHHKQAAEESFAALLDSQKYLTSNLRTLISALDSVSSLAAPKHSASQFEPLRAMAGRARALQARLAAVDARLAAIQAHLSASQPDS